MTVPLASDSAYRSAPASGSGFGSSERSDRDYTPQLMTDAVLAMLGPIRERCGPGPVDVLGVSLGCEFVVVASKRLDEDRIDLTREHEPISPPLISSQEEAQAHAARTAEQFGHVQNRSQ